MNIFECLILSNEIGENLLHVMTQLRRLIHSP